MTCRLYSRSMGYLLWVFLSKLTLFWRFSIIALGDYHVISQWGRYRIYTIMLSSVILPDIAVIRGHEDAIAWESLPLCWIFLMRIHKSHVDSPHKGQCGALKFSLLQHELFNKESSVLLNETQWHSCDVTIMLPSYGPSGIQTPHM